MKKRKILTSLIVLLLTFTVSVSVHSKEKCSELLVDLMKKDLGEEVDDDLRDYIVNESGNYWRWHEGVTLSRLPARAVGGLRRKLIRMFRNLNANQIPVLHIEDADESFVTIAKVEQIFKKNMTRAELKKLAGGEDAFKNLEKWLKTYKSYPKDMNDLLREYMSLTFAIRRIEKSGAKVEVNLPEVIINEETKEKTLEFKKVVYAFSNDERRVQILKELKQRRDAITFSRFIGKSGSKRERELEQASLKRRFQFLLERLEDAKLSLEANGKELNPELAEIYKTLRAYVDEPKELAPTRNMEIRLEGKEWWAETKELFAGLRDNKVSQFARRLYETLTEEEKKLLQLDDSGAAGRTMIFWRKNRYYVISSILLGGGVTGAANVESLSPWEKFEAIKNFFRWESSKRYECVQEERDADFYECLKVLLKEKFTLDNPLSYVAGDYEGLADVLKNDTKKINEFVAVVELAKKERDEYIEQQKRNEQFESLLSGGIRDIAEGEKSGVTSGRIFSPPPIEESLP